MKNIIFWVLDEILYLAMLLVILFEEGFNPFEKCLLMLVVGVLMHLDTIKDAIKNSNK